MTSVFVCKVDLSCLVSTIRWYHEMENGTEILIKVTIKRVEIKAKKDLLRVGDVKEIQTVNFY